MVGKMALQTRKHLPRRKIIPYWATRRLNKHTKVTEKRGTQNIQSVKMSGDTCLSAIVFGIHDKRGIELILKSFKVFSKLDNGRGPTGEVWTDTLQYMLKYAKNQREREWIAFSVGCNNVVTHMSNAQLKEYRTLMKRIQVKI